MSLVKAWLNNIKYVDRKTLFKINEEDKSCFNLFDKISEMIDNPLIKDNFRENLLISGGFLRDKLLNKSY